jgi:DNA-binding NtrC family response regulator
LVVDDEPDVRQAIRRLLTFEEYGVVFAEDAVDALKQLESHPIKVIVSDFKMPRIDGLDLLKIARDKYPDVIRILLTGNPDLDLAVEAINDIEVFRFVTKPWHNEKLKLLIQGALLEYDVRITKKANGEDAEERDENPILSDDLTSYTGTSNMKQIACPRCGEQIMSSEKAKGVIAYCPKKEVVGRCACGQEYSIRRSFPYRVIICFPGRQTKLVC